MPIVVVISDVERCVLEGRVAAATTARRDWQRAKIVLMAADGVSSPIISGLVGLNRNQVDAWKRRFREFRLEGLCDLARPGRPPLYGGDVTLAIVRTITSRPPEVGLSSRKRIRARMSMPEVGARMRANGVMISDSQVWRICSGLVLKPWQVGSWMTSHDPCFDDKAVDVCGVYLDPAENWVVFSVDEKTGMQAVSRVNETAPACPARPDEDRGGTGVRQEFEYKRHGVTGLFAAFDCSNGNVIVEPTDSVKSVNFVEFLRSLEATVPEGFEMHCVVDNLSAHGTPGVEAFLDDHPRVFLHRTPTHASWLNQVECWFSILTRQLLDTAEFESTTDMATTILEYVVEYNKTAKKFKWQYDHAARQQKDSNTTSARHH
jgi:transposase